MCGIVGYYSSDKKAKSESIDLLLSLIKQSRIRGLHSQGVTVLGGGTTKWIGKSSKLAYDFIHNVASSSSGLIYHTRYSTSGDWMSDTNNQPIDIGKISVVANSVISMKPKYEYEIEYGVSCTTDNDTEIFARILEQDKCPIEFLKNIKGSFAGLFIKNNKIWAIRNDKRPLWHFKYLNDIFFVSTVDVARRAFKMGNLTNIEVTTTVPYKLYSLEDM